MLESASVISSFLSGKNWIHDTIHLLKDLNHKVHFAKMGKSAEPLLEQLKKNLEADGELKDELIKKIKVRSSTIFSDILNGMEFESLCSLRRHWV